MSPLVGFDLTRRQQLRLARDLALRSAACAPNRKERAQARPRRDQAYRCCTVVFLDTQRHRLAIIEGPPGKQQMALLIMAEGQRYKVRSADPVSPFLELISDAAGWATRISRLGATCKSQSSTYENIPEKGSCQASQGIPSSVI